MKNKIEDLRNHLFATIEGLLDDSKPLDIARANAVANVASKLIDSAKAENDYLRITGAVEGSGFIPEAPRLPPPMGNVRQIGRQ
jgi:hypothetical protein